MMVLSDLRITYWGAHVISKIFERAKAKFDEHESQLLSQDNDVDAFDTIDLTTGLATDMRRQSTDADGLLHDILSRLRAASRGWLERRNKRNDKES